MPIEERLSNVSPFTCPECHGALWEIANGDMLRYRCHVGHAYSADAILAAQADEVERLLWSLLRSHQERAALAGRAAEAERLNGRAKLAQELEVRAHEYQQDAALVRELLRGHGSSAFDPASGAPSLNPGAADERQDGTTGSTA